MKISIAVSLLILALAAGIGWQDYRRLAVVRGDHAKLLAEAAKLGITMDSVRSEAAARVTKRGEREDKDAIARAAAMEFIAFAREMEALQEKGDSQNAEAQKRAIDFMDRLLDLDAGQLKILISELRAAEGLKDETRQGLIAFSIMTLAGDHPQVALAIFTESPDVMGGNQMGEHVVSTALASWAKKDPMAALKWVRENGEKFPDLVTEQTHRSLISGAATNDPKLAFQLIGELGLEPSSASSIMAAAKTPEQRAAAFAAYRGYLASLPDEKSRALVASSAISSLGGQLAEDGFSSATAWIEKSDLTPDELNGVTSSLIHNIRNDEKGQWIGWIGEKLPPQQAADTIRNLVTQWTEKDYQAAGKWLAAAPATPARDTSVRAYAETIAKYEPATAAQWALTLPAGKPRETTLKNIHRNWPDEDAAGKAAFAEEHGIK